MANIPVQQPYIECTQSSKHESSLPTVWNSWSKFFNYIIANRHRVLCCVLLYSVWAWFCLVLWSECGCHAAYTADKPTNEMWKMENNKSNDGIEFNKLIHNRCDGVAMGLLLVVRSPESLCRRWLLAVRFWLLLVVVLFETKSKHFMECLRGASDNSKLRHVPDSVWD